MASFIKGLHETQSVHVYTYQYHNDDIICSAVMDCGLLPNITNGMVIYNPQGGDQTLVGATATFTCNPGYTLSENSMRTCQANGTWSGSNPTCNSECLLQWRIV